MGSFEGLNVADIFAGTGAMGIEAISRGAATACFVESHKESLELLRGNIEKVGIAGLSRVIAADARQLPGADKPFNILFLDPPYRRGLGGPTLASLVNYGWVGKESLLVVEIAADDCFILPREFRVVDDRQQGNSRVMFITPAGEGKSTTAE
jgi:16S rRNA (guanine966-N2)-methyltransferase